MTSLAADTSAQQAMPSLQYALIAGLRDIVGSLVFTILNVIIPSS